jgi:transcriptional regulator with XRE-family HTH domain
MRGNSLKRKRKALGLTQRTLAERIGVHRITIAKWETGVEPIPKSIALLIDLLVKTEGKQNRG